MLALLSAVAALATQPILGTTSFRNGLQSTEFKLPEGTVTVYLPADLTAGDTVSGTVIAVPNGNGDVAGKNQGTLSGLVVTVAGEPGKRSGPRGVWTVPTSAGLAIPILLKSPSGSPVAQCDVPILPSNFAPSPTNFAVDPVASTGKPVPITGPFDGDCSNTSVSAGGKPLVPIAESPRSCVAANFNPGPGPTSLAVSDGGKTATLPFHAYLLEMTVGKSTLLQGERTSLNMKISGLQGCSADIYPIPLEVENDTPEVVRFEKGHPTIYSFAVEQNQVRNGVFSHQIGLVGINPGRFLIMGSLFSVRIHDIKRNMDLQNFKAWINGLILAYRTEIQQLEAILKANPGDAGTKLKLARKKKALSTLVGCLSATNNDLDAVKMMADKALADDSVFSLASTLISVAADLLGYTDIPMPAVGQILKGLKALAAGAKLTKALQALDKAQGLADAYDKLTDAAEKLEKLNEFKEAVKEVKEALESDE